MPLFDFECRSCGLTFSKLVRDRKITELPCVDCAEPSQKKLSIPASHFADSSRGMPRGDTGVYELDNSIDLNVGRDAKNRWEVIKDRTSEKERLHAMARQIAGNEDSKMALKRDMLTGEYQPMSVNEVRENVRLRQEYRQKDSEGLVVDTVKIPAKG